MEQEPGRNTAGREPSLALEGISAVTLATHDMARAIQFYRSLGFVLHYGGETAPFTSLEAGTSYLNLIAQPAERRWSWWGRVIFYVGDVDALYERALALGLRPENAPRDAPWGERYFHVTDPDGHEISFARPLRAGT
jgi:catechol 2,3-dioxygenase-like lactoylglutathione lyase family enzyme